MGGKDDPNWTEVYAVLTGKNPMPTPNEKAEFEPKKKTPRVRLIERPTKHQIREIKP
jgi:hypothetical protein